MHRHFLRSSLAAGVGLASFPAFAADAKIDPADTAFMIFATALVLMMTLPGLALFYAGMVRKKNVLATMAQSLAATAIVSLLWLGAGYSLAFHGAGPLVGDHSAAFFNGIGVDTVSGFAKTIPETLFGAYQLTFAVITCALVRGATADRLKFSAFVLFCVLWLFVVYIPSAHWVWGGRRRLPRSMGLCRFRRRHGRSYQRRRRRPGRGPDDRTALRIWARKNLSPLDLSMAFVGLGLLWVGRFGFNGGSASVRAPSTPSSRPISPPAPAPWSGRASNGSNAAVPRCSA